MAVVSPVGESCVTGNAVRPGQFATKAQDAVHLGTSTAFERAEDADMASRDDESNMLTRCEAASGGAVTTALDQREANVFRLAAMVLQSRFPVESGRLMQASNAYFHTHPSDLVPSGDAVRNGWVAGLPRLRDMLTARLRMHR